jgi:hypothetical protein
MDIEKSIQQLKIAVFGARLDAKTRMKINKKLDADGLGGRTFFRKAEHGLQTAIGVLQDFGIEQDGVENSYVFSQPTGRLKLDLAFSNDQDPFSPIEITNSKLIIQFTQMDSGNFEVIGYLS